MVSDARESHWVRDEDLVETVYELRVVNSATRTKASSPREAEIVELGGEGLAIKIPRTLCSEGHVLSIELTFRQKSAKQVKRAAQKRLTSGLSTAQESLEAGWAATQDMVEQGSKRLRKNAASLAEHTKDSTKDLKKYYKQQQKKRSRGRSLFRYGLILGVVVALLFAQISGAEMRKRLVVLWDQYKPLLQGK